MAKRHVSKKFRILGPSQIYSVLLLVMVKMEKFILASRLPSKTIVDEAEINFGRAFSSGCASSRPHRQVVFLDKPGNNYPDLPHSQEGVKFATQISPLLN